MMKKVFFAILSTLAIASTSYANDATDFDNDLIEEGIIDYRYKYVDDTDLYDFFREINNEAAKLHPRMIDNETEISSIELTPYQRTYSIRHTMVKDVYKFSIDDVDDEMLAGLCESAYEHKYLRANNVKSVYKYYNANYRFLGSITLDKIICKPYL